MNIEIRKAVAIRAWDIYCNDVFIDRYLKKGEASTECDKLKRKFGVNC